VIVSGGTLTHARLRTITLRTLALSVGGLTLAGLLGGLALGFQLGRTGQDGAQPAARSSLDPARPDDRAIIQQIGTLSGRMIQLEAAADRLAERVGATPSKAETKSEIEAVATREPAGGPLLAPASGLRVGAGDSLLSLDVALDQVEANLDLVASMIARRDLDEMAFPSRAPIPGMAISSGFGRRKDPFTGQPARHAGLDYPAAYGTTILASAGGRVRRAGPYGAFGKTVEIDHGGGLVTRYGHASRILVRVGDILLPGQPIATVGSTGRSTGPHLHFEILRDGMQVPPGLYLADDHS
jgi:murein DD-endopeptidase MepM/ murein hydrolase activator NlpD